ncbi:MAG TPA: polysaccharide biosynthesis/export family protein [Rhizomicrobium sp.]|jgi:protein involved in polysaccharide export with SLBB domain|nr:polysaccharide biosynthesis/export family protein [Rhizomicrobium sp.]
MDLALRSFRPWLHALAVACVAALALGMAPAAASGEPSPADGGTDYRLGTGDKVRVIVFGEDDLGGEYQIDATGFVRLPLIGQIKAGGLTAHDVEGNIDAALAQGYLNDPHVAVEVTTYRPFYVVGEVQKPGEYPFANGLSAVSAVALAGGFTPKAVQSVVYVRHQGESGERRLAADEATMIRPGDVVRVDSTTFWDVMDVLSPLAGVSALRYTVP